MKKIFFPFLCLVVMSAPSAWAADRGANLRSVPDEKMEYAIMERIRENSQVTMKPAAEQGISADAHARVDELFDTLPLKKEEKTVEKVTTRRQVYEVTKEMKEANLVPQPQPSPEELADAAFDSIEP